jgi:hypothetical protein
MYCAFYASFIHNTLHYLTCAYTLHVLIHCVLVFHYGRRCSTAVQVCAQLVSAREREIAGIHELLAL